MSLRMLLAVGTVVGAGYLACSEGGEGCTRDTDCKGDRICTAGVCLAPGDGDAEGGSDASTGLPGGADGGSDAGTGGPGGSEVTLTVVKTGSGGGTVTSFPSGIGCGTTCVANFPRGTRVTLAVQPGPNSTIAGWGGLTCEQGSGGDAGVAGCAFDLNASLEVNLSFSCTACYATTCSAGLPFYCNQCGNGTNNCGKPCKLCQNGTCTSSYYQMGEGTTCP